MSEHNLAGELKKFIRAYMRDEFDGMLPARVLSHDRDNNRVELQPMVMIGTKDGGRVPRAQLSNIPVFRFGGGGFFISMPLNTGDTGWVMANDRDISLVMQSASDEWPNTIRMHNFSDAVFFPDALTSWAIDGKNAGALVLQSSDGSTCIALDNGRVEIDTDGVTVNAQQTTINCPDNTINGGLTVTEDIVCGATITAATDVVAAGVSLTGHVHPYTWTSSSGSGNTGAGQ